MGMRRGGGDLGGKGEGRGGEVEGYGAFLLLGVMDL